MSDLAMDINTNDLLIVNGDLSLATGTDAIAQNLQQVLQLWLGEWFLDTTVGIPFKQQILIKNPQMDVVQADLALAVSTVAGITQIEDLSFNYDAVGRSLTVYVVAQDSNGQTITAQATIALPTTATIQGTVYP